MERIVVGVDGSAASLDALGWATNIAERADIRITAVRAWTPDQAEVWPEVHEKLRAESLRELDDWCASAPVPFPARTMSVEGDPAVALLDAASAEHADLLVVGTRGAGGFARLHLGSVATHLTHHTTTPLAVVPRGAAGAAASRFVVGTDGSAGSAAAVRFCAELAAALALPVTAVLAEEPFLEWVPASDPRSWHRAAEAKVREWAMPIDAVGVPLDVLVDRDIHPVAALARVLEAAPGCIAVVGVRGLGGFSGLRLGRVPTQLVHHTCGVVILVPPASDR